MINTITKPIRKLIQAGIRTGFTENKAPGHIFNHDDKNYAALYTEWVSSNFCAMNEEELLSEARWIII